LLLLLLRTGGLGDLVLPRPGRPPSKVASLTFRIAAADDDDDTLLLLPLLLLLLLPSPALVRGGQTSGA
jgi:hypothetical protein